MIVLYIFSQQIAVPHKDQLDLKIILKMYLHTVNSALEICSLCIEVDAISMDFGVFVRMSVCL